MLGIFEYGMVVSTKQQYEELTAAWSTQRELVRSPHSSERHCKAASRPVENNFYGGSCGVAHVDSPCFTQPRWFCTGSLDLPTAAKLNRASPQASGQSPGRAFGEYVPLCTNSLGLHKWLNDGL